MASVPDQAWLGALPPSGPAGCPGIWLPWGPTRKRDGGALCRGPVGPMLGGGWGLGGQCGLCQGTGHYPTAVGVAGRTQMVCEW